MLKIQSVYLDGFNDDSSRKNSLSDSLLVNNLNDIFSYKNIFVTGKSKEDCSLLPNAASLEIVNLKSPTKGALATSLLSIDNVS